MGIARGLTGQRLAFFGKVYLRTMLAALASPTSLALHTFSKRLTVGWVATAMGYTVASTTNVPKALLLTSFRFTATTMVLASNSSTPERPRRYRFDLSEIAIASRQALFGVKLKI